MEVGPAHVLRILIVPSLSSRLLVLLEQVLHFVFGPGLLVLLLDRLRSVGRVVSSTRSHLPHRSDLVLQDLRACPFLCGFLEHFELSLVLIDFALCVLVLKVISPELVDLVVFQGHSHCEEALADVRFDFMILLSRFLLATS